MLAFCFGFILVLNLIHEGASELKACEPDEFPCNDGSCIDKKEWCDSKANCDDDSDELYCFLKSGLISNPNRCNQSLYFLCNDGRCIPAVGRCDGYSSCDDDSDEENCGIARETLLVSDNGTIQLPMKTTEWSLDSKISGDLYDHENLMLSDNVSHTEMTSRHTTTTSVSKLNSSEDSLRSLISKQMDGHNTEASTISANVSTFVSNNFTDDRKVYSEAPTNHQHALEFRDLIGMLNASQNEQNLTSDKNSTVEVDFQNKLAMDSEMSINKNQSHLNMHYADKQNSNIHHDSIKYDLHKGYVKLNVRDFKKAKEAALKWLVDSRDWYYGWGDETARGLIALWMADYSVGRPGDVQLMMKQLHLKLFALMSRNETLRISLGELALFINALSAACDNPSNFYGHNLVNILRYRTNVAQESSKYVSPLVYMVLCLHNASSYMDVIKIRDTLHDAKITKTDSDAMLSLAATCISRIPKFSTIPIGQMASKKLYLKTMGKLPRNIYELALLTQAFNEARINQDLWNRAEAMRRIIELQETDGSFGDILGTYYAVPTLSGKSFLSISKICPGINAGPTPMELLINTKDETIYFQYTLRFGDPLEMSQSLTMKIHTNTSFMDIMNIAATKNPAYKFKFDASEGKPTVYWIGGIANDAEKGLYWVPYTSYNSTKEFVPFEGDIRNFIPALGEGLVFWRRPIF